MNDDGKKKQYKIGFILCILATLVLLLPLYEFTQTLLVSVTFVNIVNVTGIASMICLMAYFAWIFYKNIRPGIFSISILPDICFCI